MSVNRRQFLRGVAFGGAAAVAAPAEDAHAIARDNLEMPPKALGMLYDSTLCVGCKACVAACKEANGKPPEIPEHLGEWNRSTWDSAEYLSGETLNVIQVYQNGTMETKDKEENGFAFVKRHCLHCVDPSCVSVCPVSAMRKDPETGIVTHDPDACIGCRYCVFGCPFGVPQYQINDPFGKIAKCEFCLHLQKEGRVPACCDVCPTGASLFGLVDDLQEEAERRLAMAPGDAYAFPRGKLGDDRPTHDATIAEYKKEVYGVTEGGGTQIRYIAGVPFEKLGLPKLPERAYSAVSEGMQHTLFQGMVTPAVLFGGLMYFAYRSSRQHAAEEDQQDADHAGGEER